jgi:transposase
VATSPKLSTVLQNNTIGETNGGALNVRYVRPLTEQQRALLENTMKIDTSHRARMRAHGLLLSSEGITIKAIAKIYHVDRDTVATWIKKWEKHGDKSLHDQPRSGRPTTLNAAEKELAKQYLTEEPRSLKNVAERLAQKTAKCLIHAAAIFAAFFAFRGLSINESTCCFMVWK